MRAFLLAAPILAVLAGCQAVPGRDPAVADRAATCERRLQDYDRAALFFSDTGWNRDQVISTQVQRAARRAREADCVTGGAVTDRLASALPRFRETLVRETPGGEQGASIERTWLQVGIVEGIISEVQARDFFAGLGFSVRSRGAPALGRRIFIGPFATEGGLAGAVDLSQRAGFIAPYPRRF